MHREKEKAIKEGEEKTGWQWFHIRMLAVSWTFPTKQRGTFSVNSGPSQKTSPHTASDPFPLHSVFAF